MIITLNICEFQDALCKSGIKEWVYVGYQPAFLHVSIKLFLLWKIRLLLSECCIQTTLDLKPIRVNNHCIC